MTARFDDLICPDCHTAVLCDVKDGQGSLACSKGHGPWPVENGVARFIEGKVPHDGRWMATYREPRGWGLIQWLRRRDGQWRIPSLLRPMLARSGQHPLDIVDLGCGGGWEFLTTFGCVTGVDYGAEALADAASIYGRVIRSPVERLPLADRSVDAVVSVWMFEHLREQQFVATLREVRRVLRPGGRLIFVADLDSSKPILRWAKQFPEEYVRHHIENVGHHGLRSLVFTKFLLQREGFVENETIPVNKSSLLQPMTALWMFDNELGRRSRLLRIYLLGCRLAMKSRSAHLPVYLALMEYHRLVDRWLPDTYAFSAAFDWILPETRGTTVPAALRGAVQPAGGSEIDPWSGLPIAEEYRGRRPVAVMVDNHGHAHPQRGLASASIVIEAPVEYGITRLMPVFTRPCSGRVGPVRSARPYFIEWAGAYQPYYIHCGGSLEALSLLEHPESVIDLECRYHKGATGELEVAQNAAVTVIDESRTPPHHLFAVPDRIFGRLEELTLTLPEALEQLRASSPDSLSRFRPVLAARFRDEATREEDRTAQVRIEIHSQPTALYPEQFEWDGRAMGFRRAVLNTPIGEDATRDPELLIANLVLIWVRVTTIPGDVKRRLRIETSGEGPAQIWCGPRPEPATWLKIAPDDPIHLRDAHGSPLSLRRGLTWIHALPEDAIVRVR